MDNLNHANLLDAQNQENIAIQDVVLQANVGLPQQPPPVPILPEPAAAILQPPGQGVVLQTPILLPPNSLLDPRAAQLLHQLVPNLQQLAQNLQLPAPNLQLPAPNLQLQLQPPVPILQHPPAPILLPPNSLLEPRAAQLLHQLVPNPATTCPNPATTSPKPATTASPKPATTAPNLQLPAPSLQQLPAPNLQLPAPSLQQPVSYVRAVQHPHWQPVLDAHFKEQTPTEVWFKKVIFDKTEQITLPITYDLLGEFVRRSPLSSCVHSPLVSKSTVPVTIYSKKLLAMYKGQPGCLYFDEPGKPGELYWGSLGYCFKVGSRIKVSYYWKVYEMKEYGQKCMLVLEINSDEEVGAGPSGAGNVSDEASGAEVNAMLE